MKLDIRISLEGDNLLRFHKAYHRWMRMNAEYRPLSDFIIFCLEYEVRRSEMFDQIELTHPFPVEFKPNPNPLGRNVEESK